METTQLFSNMKMGLKKGGGVAMYIHVMLLNIKMKEMLVAHNIMEEWQRTYAVWKNPGARLYTI